MSGFPVVVRAGRDYLSPPRDGDGLLPADVLTSPSRWLAAGNGYDNTQPAPVPVANGMRLTWTTDPDKGAVQGVWFDATAGRTYTVSVTVRAASGSAQWRTTVGWSASAAWATPDGYDQTRTLSWTAPETRTYLAGVETVGTNDSQHTVTAIGVWDHDDPAAQWAPRDLDNCRIALPVTIQHGRSGVDTQPDAPTCTFTYTDQYPPTSLGDSIEVEVSGQPGELWTDPGVLWTDPDVSWLGTRGKSLRFRGYITDLRAVEVAGRIVAWAVQATGEQARLGRIPIDISRPAESDAQRVQAIAAAAGVPITVLGSTSIDLVADNIRRDALGALHEVCATAGGLLWQARDGSMVYGTLNRHEAMPQWRLTCNLILDGVQWRHTTDEIVNHVTVEWGPESSRTQDTYRDDDSIAKWGYRHADVGTMCATSDDAALLGLIVLGKRAQPRWVMPGVVALRDQATAAQWAQVAALGVGHTALIDIETAPAATPGAITSWTVEGWVETWASEGRRIQLALSEYRLGVPIPWSTADDHSWRHWADTASWLTAMLAV